MKGNQVKTNHPNRTHSASMYSSFTIVPESITKPPYNKCLQPTRHCGAVELEVQLPDGIVDPRRCNCSICRRKGAVVGSVPLSGLKVVKGKDKLSLYQFDTKEAEHYFCSVCGIYTHHKRRSNPNQYGINLGCLEDVDPNLIEGVEIHDGANNHPSDRRAS
jgi:hypothetical protein